MVDAYIENARNELLEKLNFTEDSDYYTKNVESFITTLTQITTTFKHDPETQCYKY